MYILFNFLFTCIVWSISFPGMFPGFRRGTNDNFVQSEWRMGVKSVLQLLDDETLDRCRERHDLTGVKLQVYIIVASILNHFFAIHSSHTTNSLLTHACFYTPLFRGMVTQSQPFLQKGEVFFAEFVVLLPWVPNIFQAGKSPSVIGDTSSKDVFLMVMLVFGGVEWPDFDVKLWW